MRHPSKVRLSVFSPTLNGETRCERKYTLDSAAHIMGMCGRGIVNISSAFYLKLDYKIKCIQVRPLYLIIYSPYPTYYYNSEWVTNLRENYIHEQCKKGPLLTIL